MEEASNDKGELFPPSVGERLAAARMEQGLSLAQIAERTRVPLRHLEKIETGSHEGLPAIPYSAGFVKCYAQLLGLDGARLAHDFRAELSGDEQVRKYPEPLDAADPARVPPRSLAIVALVAAIVLAIVYMVWRGSGTSADERATLAAGTATRAVIPLPQRTTATPTTAQPAPPVAATGQVAVTATEAAWVKIYQKDGPTLFQGEMAPGQRFDIPATVADPLIWTGRPQAFRITVGTSAVPSLGDPDRTIRDVSLKADALLGRAPAPLAPIPATPRP